jgi:hypothetical protein
MHRISFIIESMTPDEFVSFVAFRENKAYLNGIEDGASRAKFRERELKMRKARAVIAQVLGFGKVKRKAQ